MGHKQLTLSLLKAFVMVGIIALATPLYALEPLQVKLQELADNHLKKYGEQEHISAVMLSVNTTDTKGTLTAYSGFTDHSSTLPLTHLNLFQIGSITKSFTSAILLQLEANPLNNFSINDHLSKYFPEYPKWGKVTVKQLLNMTSGIPNYTENLTFAFDAAKNPRRQWTEEELINYAYSMPLRNNAYYYSNTNYILAGMLISKLTKHSVEEEMKSHFFDKDNVSHLDLKNTFYITHQYPSYLTDRLVHGYYSEKDGIFPFNTDVTDYTLSWAGAAGANISNTEDIISWVKGLFNSNQVLAHKQRKELMQLVSVLTGKPIKTVSEQDPAGFGLGISASFDSENPADIIYNYEGQTVGFRAFYIYVPTKNITIAATVNSAVGDDNDHLAELMVNAYSLLLGSAAHVQFSSAIKY
jgi:D-alanyl-D-alanine carboxypeptidase